VLPSGRTQWLILSAFSSRARVRQLVGLSDRSLPRTVDRAFVSGLAFTNIVTVFVFRIFFPVQPYLNKRLVLFGARSHQFF